MSHDFKSPTVSVIVLSYNHVATVARAIDSVLELRSQSIDLEIVIGDDGSTDGCYELCAEYARWYPDIVRLMPREPNMGVVLNYFRCLRACRGEFITDCAADDCRLPGQWLARQVTMLKSDPALVAVGSDWVECRGQCDIHSNNSDVRSRWRRFVPGHEIMREVLASVGVFPMPLSAMLYRREAVDANDSKVCNPEFGCEDLPLICALGAKGDFGFVDEESLVYFVGDGSISNNVVSGRMLRFYYKTLVCRLSLAQHYNIITPDVAYAITHGMKFVVGLAFDSGDKESIAQVRTLVADNSGYAPLSVRLKLLLSTSSMLWSIVRQIKRCIKRYYTQS